MASQKNSPEDRQLLGELLQSVKSTSELLQKLHNDVSSQAVALESLRTESAGLQRTVESLSKLIRDGNGQKPLLTRVALLESREESHQRYVKEELQEIRVLIKEKVEQIDKSLTDHAASEEQSLTAIKDELAQRTAHDRSLQITRQAGKWTLGAALISSIAALIVGILALWKEPAPTPPIQQTTIPISSTTRPTPTPTSLPSP